VYGQGSGRTKVIAVLLGAVMLGACTSPDEEDPVVVQPGAPGEPGEVVDDPTPVAGQPYTVTDVRFLHAMIPHHAQALEMTALVADRTERDDLVLFARRIEISQEAEIDQMEDWLATRGEAPSAEGHDEHGATGPVPGMLNEAQLAELSAASGEEFDRLFLERMIGHHEGALTMVADLLAAGGAQEAALFDMVSNIDADQRIEIDRMTDLLAELDGA
jgi:uncharacterized protein (DUF305 family)